MTHTRPCPGCLSPDSQTYCIVAGHALRACRICATIFTASLPYAGDEHDYDAYYDEGNLAVPAFVDRRLEEIVGTFDRYRRSNRWLDVGCGAGALLRAARREGWEATGTEVAPQPAHRLRSEGFEVLLGDASALDLPEAAFDVVSLVEVIEHVPNPDAQLAAAASALRVGGALYVTTPHARGLSSRLLRERWSIVAPPEHLQLYSVAGLREALSRAGFARVSARTEGADPRAIAGAFHSGHNRATEAPGDRVARAYQLNEALSSRRTGALVKRSLNAVLAVTRLGDGLKVVAERSS